MATKKKLKAVVKPSAAKKAPVGTAVIVPTEAETLLPSGTLLTKGMALTVTGVDGVFRFCYARHAGQEITCYGGTGVGEKAYHSFRTFRPERIKTATANLVTAKLVAKAQASMPAEYEAMSPGQKAAFTKRMRAAQAAQAVAS